MFISGVLFVALSVLPVREWIINSIPVTLKLAISAGIGLFLAVIALRNCAVVVADPVTMVGLGELRAPAPHPRVHRIRVHRRPLHAERFPVRSSSASSRRRCSESALGVSEWKGFVSLPPDPRPTLFQLDIDGALALSLAPVIFSFLFIDLFDTAGTLVGVAHRAGLLDSRNRLPRANRALLADSTATVAGAMLGTSTTTSYIESAAGIEAGGRTGLTAVVVAALFLLCLFFAPLAQSVPGYATAPALLFVACLMARGLAEIDWEDATEYAPAVTHGVGHAAHLLHRRRHGPGLHRLCRLEAGQRRGSRVSARVLAIAVLFGARFVLL